MQKIDISHPDWQKIEMPKVGDAKAAMKSLNGEDVAGKKIRVKKAESKPDAGNNPEAGSNE